ncbi:MAG: two pore domain potassium channel family protein, partial [Armatimonadetes bacterium]|nr:two pore domain potassium channel family protein [Armatimonadota bacterium]
LVNVVESLNRGRRALRQSMQRRGAGYVMALTVVVLLVGGAGIYAFEGTRSGGSLPSYADAVYFTLMLLTTIGSEFWPATAEGKLLTVLLGIYAIAVFGYVTATLATYFVGRDAESEEGQVAGVADLAALRTELAALRDELRALRTELQ